MSSASNIPVNSNSNFYFIKKLPSELIEEIFRLLPKNVAWDVLHSSNLTLPIFNPPGVNRLWYRSLKIKRWLLRQVYVYAYDLEVRFNWFNDELKWWLVLSERKYELMLDQRVEWPYTVVLCPMPRPRYNKKLLIDPKGTIRAGQYWLHPNNGVDICAIGLPLRSNQHLSRLTLATYTFNDSVSTSHRVDSLQLNGRHPHLDRVIDLSSVKQLTVLTSQNVDAEVFNHAPKFTLLKDLFVGNVARLESFTVFSNTVSRLVVWGSYAYNYRNVAKTSLRFSLLTYLEVTFYKDRFNWPRIWCQRSKRSPTDSVYEGVKDFENYYYECLETIVLQGCPFRVVRRGRGRMVTEYVGNTTRRVAR
ncbi:hypothetical protein JNB11_05825 [Kocuria palustris]|nr:hypothetical protein [Kocuria palustris]